MQKREKILLGLVVGLVGILGLNYGYNALQRRFDERELRITSLRRDISKKELELRKGLKARQRLTDYEARSLPSDTGLAQTLYQNWLIGLLDESGLAGGITSLKPQAQRGAYERLNFTVNAQGPLSKVVELLHAFYAGGHLHQIKSFSLSPLQDGQKFDISLAVEAVALPTAASTESLASAPARPRNKDLAAYTKTIAERNVFAPYKAPPPKVEITKTAPPAFDVAKHTTVSAILTQPDGQPQVWLNNRTTGQILRLSEGSPFSIGNFQGTIQRIGVRDIEILAGGQRFLLALGENLREGNPVPEGDL